jgi:hypothetical protein
MQIEKCKMQNEDTRGSRRMMAFAAPSSHTHGASAIFHFSFFIFHFAIPQWRTIAP